SDQRQATSDQQQPNDCSGEFRPPLVPVSSMRVSRSRLGRAAVLLIALTVPALGADLKGGDVLGPDNWQAARGLLPDEFLDSYNRGDFRHPIADYKLERFGDDPVFREALDANRGRYGLDAQGSIIDLRTGKPPDYVYAWPFPDIDPKDPQAAMKIVWNYYYTMYYGGNRRTPAALA